MGIEALLTSQVIGLDAALTGKLSTSGGTVTGQLTNALGTITASTPLTISQTWNNAAVSFNALSIALTDSASDSLSTSINVSVDSQPRLRHTVKNNRNRLSLFSRYAGFDNELWYAEVGSTGGFGGFVACPGGVMESITTNGNSFYYVSTVASSNYRQWFLQAGSKIKVGQSTTFEWYGADYRADTNTSDLVLARDAAGTLAQRNSTNAQTFRLANTYTSSTSFENLQLQWASNEARIGTSVGSAGGTQRSLVLGAWNSAGTWTAGLTLATTGRIGIGTESPSATCHIVDNASADNVPVCFIDHTSNLTSTRYRDGLLIGEGTSSNDCVLGLWTDGTNNRAFIQSALYGESYNAALALQSQGGNVGIGIEAPTSKLHIAETWNNVATTFTSILANVTDTASASGSLLMDLQVGGTSKFSVGKGGFVSVDPGTGGPIRYSFVGQTTSGLGYFNSGLLAYAANVYYYLSTSGISSPSASYIGWTSSADSTTGHDLKLFRDAARTLALRDGVNANVLNIYNTYTSSTSYERGKIAWESNVLKIGTEKGSAGGSARDLELQTDGTTRVTVGTNLITMQAATGGPYPVYFDNNGLHVGSQRNYSFNADGTAYIGGALYAQSTIAWTTAGGADAYINKHSYMKLGIYGDNGLVVRNHGNTADADITAKAATFSGNVTVSAVNLVTDTTTGTKIGTGTTQKIGFYNKTPVVQPTAVADATDAASVITQLNALLSRMRDLGLIAT